MRAGVIEILAFEENLRTAQLPAQTLGMVDGRRPADVMLQIMIQLGDEFRVLHVALVGHPQFLDGLHQGFRHEDAPVRAEVAALVGQIVGFSRCLHGSQIVVPH